VLKLMAGDPRLELGLPVPESYGLKIKQYFMDYLGLFCSGITPFAIPYSDIKDRTIQEVVRFSVDPVGRGHPSICGK